MLIREFQSYVVRSITCCREIVVTVSHGSGRSKTKIMTLTTLKINNHDNPAVFKVGKHNVVSELCHQHLHPRWSPPGRRLRCSVDLGADIWTGSPCLTWKASGLVGEPDYWYLDREQARRPSCPHLEGATTALYRCERPLTIGKTTDNR